MSSQVTLGRDEVRIQIQELLKYYDSKIDFSKPLRPQIDSLSLVELVEAIETRFGISVTYSDFSKGFLRDLDQTVDFLISAASRKTSEESQS